MHDETKLQLMLVADNSERIVPLANLVAHYTAEINERRRQLRDELSYFETKLRDLEQLDPLDFTGLTKINREHATHIRRLLSGFDEDGVDAAG